MRCLQIALVLVAAAAFTTPKTTRGGLVLSTTKPAALLRSTATLQEEAVVVNILDDTMPKLALALPTSETQTQTALLDAADMLAALGQQPVPVRLTTDDDVAVFEASAFAADDHGGVLTQLRGSATNYLVTWARTHHLGVIDDHSTSRKRASQLPAMQRRVAAVNRMLQRGEQPTHGLDKAAKEWLDLVCVSPTSRLLELKAPFSELAVGYNYGPCEDRKYIDICPPAALLYKVQQWMSCRDHLPLFMQEAAACFFADHSLSQRNRFGMGQPISLGMGSPVRYALAEAKCQWAGVIAEGLETGFKGVFVVGMLGPDFRRWAHKHSLPDAVVVDCSSLGPDDFSLRKGAVRSAAFRKIFDACCEHGVLGPGDETLLAGALYNLGRGTTDLIESLEVLAVEDRGNGVFVMRGNPRAFKKVKSWTEDLPAARELRDALAPSSMGVSAFLEACTFVLVADSAQIKSRHRRHRRDSLVDLCTGTGGRVGRGRRRRLVRQAGLRAGALPQRGQDGAVDGAERPGARPHPLQPL